MNKIRWFAQILNLGIQTRPIKAIEVLIREKWMTDGGISVTVMKGEGPNWHCQEVGFGYMEKKKELIPGKTKPVLRKC